MVRLIGAPLALERALAEVIAEVRAHPPGAERDRRLFERLRENRALAKLLLDPLQPYRISGDNDLQELDEVLAKLKRLAGGPPSELAGLDALAIDRLTAVR